MGPNTTIPISEKVVRNQYYSKQCSIRATQSRSERSPGRVSFSCGNQPKEAGNYRLGGIPVEVENEKPIFVQARKMHPDKQAIIDQEVDEMRRNGIVSPVQFPEWGFPAKFVSKADGSNRLVTDFRRLNDITKQSTRFGKTSLWIFDCIKQFQYHIARHLFTWDFDNGGHCTIGMRSTRENGRVLCEI
ncbi:unnamed protein product [Umbelopsis ramanniana]